MTSVHEALLKYVIFFIAELHVTFCTAIFRMSSKEKMQKLTSLSTPFLPHSSSRFPFFTHQSETKSGNRVRIVALLIH